MTKGVRLEASPICPIKIPDGHGWIYRWNTGEYQIGWRQKPKGMKRSAERRIIREMLLSGSCRDNNGVSLLVRAGDQVECDL